MTDKDIEKLANKIAETLIKKQEEYDALFEIDMNKLAEENQIGYSVFPVTVISNESNNNKQDAISELEAKLKVCINEEDYKQASELRDKIKKLKDEKS
jgi:protein-arginine kinase activator protein McsA